MLLSLFNYSWPLNNTDWYCASLLLCRFLPLYTYCSTYYAICSWLHLQIWNLRCGEPTIQLDANFQLHRDWYPQLLHCARVNCIHSVFLILKCIVYSVVYIWSLILKKSWKCIICILPYSRHCILHLFLTLWLLGTLPFMLFHLHYNDVKLLLMHLMRLDLGKAIEGWKMAVKNTITYEDSDFFAWNFIS